MQHNPYPRETRLHGTPLVLARLVWIALVSAILIACSVTLSQVLTAPITICDSGCAMKPTEAAAWTAAGYSPAMMYGLLSTVLGDIFMPLGFIVTAVLIAWQRSDDWVALLVSFALVGWGPYLLGGVNAQLSVLPAWQPLTLLLLACSTLSFTSLFFVFPDGAFVPRWTRWLFAAFVIVFVGATLVDFRQVLAGTYVGGGNSSTPADIVQILAALLMFLVGAGAQVYRYRRVADTVQRQQIKWIVFGLLGPVLTLLIYLTVFPRIESFGNWIVPVESVAIVLRVILALAWPVTVAIAILRYRLFDIDLIIRRTLIYAVLTLALAIVYFGSVVLLQGGLRALTGQASDLAIVASTLLIAALFAPLRSRIQRWIDRRLYRQRYDAARVLEAFGVTVRDQVDLDQLNGELLSVVSETMRPAHASLWVRKSGRG